MSVSEKRTTSPEAAVLRTGQARIKGNGMLSSWIWKAKSLVLTDQALVSTGFKIPLSNISKVERDDSKPFCLLLEAKFDRKKQRFYISFKDDGELYDWQDDVYTRCPMIGASLPTGFVHHVHVGFDPVSGAFTGVPSQWNDSHVLPTPTPTDTAPANTSLIEDPKATTTRKRRSRPLQRSSISQPATLPFSGYFSIKGDGFILGWIWRNRWLVLTLNKLAIHKSEHSPSIFEIDLVDIVKVSKGLTRDFHLRIELRNGKYYLLMFNNEWQLSQWFKKIEEQVHLGGMADISLPWNFLHNVHVGIDPATGAFTGLPENWKTALQQIPQQPVAAPS